MIFSTVPSALKIEGALGVALNVQVVSSIYLGPDEFGVERFDTTRSEVGEALFLLKYRNDKAKAVDLAETVWDFLRRRPKAKSSIDFIVTVPPSNVDRAYQPVELIAQHLSVLSEIPLSSGDLMKIKETRQLKDVKNREEKQSILDGAFEIEGTKLTGSNVLLLDDLYDSGATTQAVVDALIQKGKVASVRVLALTRTRSRK